MNMNVSFGVSLTESVSMKIGEYMSTNMNEFDCEFN